MAEYDLDGWTAPDLINPDDIKPYPLFGDGASGCDVVPMTGVSPGASSAPLTAKRISGARI